MKYCSYYSQPLLAEIKRFFSLLALLQFPLLCFLHVGPHCKVVSLNLFPACVCFVCCRRRKAGILPSLEDLLFYTIAEGQEKIPAHKFTTVSPAFSHSSGTRQACASRPLFTACSCIDSLSGLCNPDNNQPHLLPQQALKATGLRTGDPRLKECMEMLKVTLKTTSDGALDRHLFKK